MVRTRNKVRIDLILGRMTPCDKNIIVCVNLPLPSLTTRVFESDGKYVTASRLLALIKIRKMFCVLWAGRPRFKHSRPHTTESL
jgi:hypothetical protein